MDHSQKMSRSFDWHNATQFLGALNDNVFRWLMVFFLIGLLGNDKASAVTSLTGVVFVVPFLIFTPLAGVHCGPFQQTEYHRGDQDCRTGTDGCSGGLSSLRSLRWGFMWFCF